jgi:hypothetical protein
MKKKYAYANIKIPVELKANGTIEPLKEYVQIEFSICNELPEKNVNNLNVMNSLHSLFHNIPNFENRPSNKIPVVSSNDNERPIFNIHSYEPQENRTMPENPPPCHSLFETHDRPTENPPPCQSLFEEHDRPTENTQSYQSLYETHDRPTENTPTEVPISLIKQYKKREGASMGSVGSPESFKNKKRNKFNITAKLRE